MMQSKHSFIFLALLLLMGQGSLFMHDMNHVVVEDASDCLLCIKLDKQEHGLPVAGHVELTALVDAETDVSPCPDYDTGNWRSCCSRAPPLSV